MDDKNKKGDSEDKRRRVIMGEESFNSTSEGEGSENSEVKNDPNTPPEEKAEDDSLLSHIIKRTRGNKNQVFDEKRDKELAEDLTRSVPPQIIEKEKGSLYDSDRKAIDYGGYDEETPEDDVIIRDAEYIENPSVHKSYKDLTDREKRDLRVKRRTIGIITGAVIFAVLFWTVPLIQKAIFQTKGNTLVFVPQTGFWGPRMGIVEIVLGIIGIILLLYTFLGKRRESTVRRVRSQDTKSVILRRASIVLALLLPLGFSNLFNFTEFRNSDLRFGSLFNRNDLKDYKNVSNQEVFLLGKDIIYRVTAGNKKAQFAINQQSVEVVKSIDSLLAPQRTVAIDSQTFQEIIKSGIYTEKEAYDVYKYKAQ